jgi:hypothetical protein
VYLPSYPLPLASKREILPSGRSYIIFTRQTGGQKGQILGGICHRNTPQCRYSPEPSSPMMWPHPPHLCTELSGLSNKQFEPVPAISTNPPETIKLMVNHSNTNKHFYLLLFSARKEHCVEGLLSVLCLFNNATVTWGATW